MRYLVLLLIIFCSVQLLAQKPMYALKKEGKWYFYNTHGKEMFPPKKGIDKVRIFEHGTTIVDLEMDENFKDIHYPKQAILTEKGKLIELPYDTNCSYFSQSNKIEGKSYICKKCRFGITNHENSDNIDRMHYGILTIYDESAKVIFHKPNYVLEILGNKLLAITTEAEAKEWQNEKNYEIWNIKNNKKLFNFKATAIRAYGDELLKFQRDGKWGLLDTLGNILVNAKYQQIGVFSVPASGFTLDGLNEDSGYVGPFISDVIAVVDEHGKYGLIDKKGNWLLEPKYQWAYYAGDSLWTFSYHNGKENTYTDDEDLAYIFEAESFDWILVNHKGEIFPDYKWEHAQGTADALFLNKAPCYMPTYDIENGDTMRYIYNGTTHGIMNTKGKWIYLADSIMDTPMRMGDGYFLAKDNKNNTVFLNKKGEIVKNFEKNRIYSDRFVNDLAAAIHYKEDEELLGYLKKDGTWAIEPGIIPWHKESYFQDLRPANDGFIYSSALDRPMFYDHKGNLIKGVDGDYDKFIILQPLQKAWTRI